MAEQHKYLSHLLGKLIQWNAEVYSDNIFGFTEFINKCLVALRHCFRISVMVSHSCVVLYDPTFRVYLNLEYFTYFLQ